jgi:transcription antitermination factor NusA-like protein
MGSIDMQTMRYINILDRVTRVKTMKCFSYNNIIIFAVPKVMVSRAIGPGASNIRIISEQLGKRIKIIAEPSGLSDAERFVSDIVSPIRFVSVELKDNVLVLNAGSQSKASLIGRNRRREEELNQIIKDSFGIELKIV